MQTFSEVQQFPTGHSPVMHSVHNTCPLTASTDVGRMQNTSSAYPFGKIGQGLVLCERVSETPGVLQVMMFLIRLKSNHHS